MPYLRATMIGDSPGCKLSAAISRFCSAVQRRRRSRPVITSIRRLRLLVRSVVGASSAANATAITPSSSLKDDRWRDSHRVAQCAAATPLTLQQELVSLADCPFGDEAAALSATTLEQFLSGLRTAWQDGEVR